MPRRPVILVWCSPPTIHGCPLVILVFFLRVRRTSFHKLHGRPVFCKRRLRPVGTSLLANQPPPHSPASWLLVQPPSWERRPHQAYARATWRLEKAVSAHFFRRASKVTNCTASRLEARCSASAKSIPASKRSNASATAGLSSTVTCGSPTTFFSAFRMASPLNS